jgi:hypothetical protein
VVFQLDVEWWYGFEDMEGSVSGSKQAIVVVLAELGRGDGHGLVSVIIVDLAVEEHVGQSRAG